MGNGAGETAKPHHVGFDAVPRQKIVAETVLKRENFRRWVRLSPGQSTDCECEWMRWSGSAFGPLCECHRAILCAIAFILICGAPARGQDVAEAARQEKARKAAEQKSPRHVYTEE